MNLEVFKHKKARLKRSWARSGQEGAVHMLIVKENIALRQNPICKVSTGFFFLGQLPAIKEKGRGLGCWGQAGCTVVGLLGVCVFADHCKTDALWRRQSDCHSAGFSSLNKVGVSNRTSMGQEIPPQLRQLSEADRCCLKRRFSFSYFHQKATIFYDSLY